MYSRSVTFAGGEMSDKGAMEAGRLGVMLLMYSIVADILVPSR